MVVVAGEGAGGHFQKSVYWSIFTVCDLLSWSTSVSSLSRVSLPYLILTLNSEWIIENLSFWIFVELFFVTGVPSFLSSVSQLNQSGFIPNFHFQHCSFTPSASAYFLKVFQLFFGKWSPDSAIYLTLDGGGSSGFYLQFSFIFYQTKIFLFSMFLASLPFPLFFACLPACLLFKMSFSGAQSIFMSTNLKLR